MSLYESLVRPLAFLLNPERAHNLGLALISRGLVSAKSVVDPRLGQPLFGTEFANPIGLAAGFDKNAVAVDRWHRLGFGFAELGTITFRAQPGNPKPRLFRLPESRGLINRMGFNNDGAERIAERLKKASPGLPVGINLGKSKITELEKASEDYRESFRLLRGLGAYTVVNVSSPNTPGLRSLQEKGPLIDIVQAILGIDPTVPLFVKVAPDLELSALDDVLEVAVQEKLTGLIATNTTLSRGGVAGPHAAEAGGLSGKPLRGRSDEVLAHLARAKTDLILIGVGGIFAGEDVFRKFALGAHLTQIYTGWIYGGPATVPRLLRELLDLMDRDGIESLDALRGSQLD